MHVYEYTVFILFVVLLFNFVVLLFIFFIEQEIWGQGGGNTFMISRPNLQ